MRPDPFTYFLRWREVKRRHSLGFQRKVLYA